MADNDALYIKGLREGDRVVFEKIFREYYPLLCNHARRYIPDKSTAEEVVQDFFCKLWERRFEIQINTSFNNYLYKSVVNHCYNHFRKVETERKIIDYGDNDLSEVQTVHSTMHSNELDQQVSIALLELPEKRREIFELSRFEGLKYHEIAERLNISVKTVETQMTRSLEFLRKYLKEYLSTIVLIMSMITKW